MNTHDADAAGLEVERLDRADVIHGFATLHAQASNEVVLMAEAKGMRVIDQRGREFLDAGAGLWCMNVGYGRQSIADAAAAQMAKLPYFHTFGNFSNEPMARLSDRLLKLAPRGMSRVVFASSGSEANDTQIKIVRRYNNLLGRPKKKKIIARLSSYHGSTVAAASLSGLPMMHRTFDLPMPGILHTLATDYHRRPTGIETPEQFTQHLVDNLARLIETEGPDTIAAFIAEPVTGTGGVLMPPPGYFREMKKVLDRYDVLLIADEVITGFGRTGSWFASPDLGIEPDLMSIAKGLTSGYFPMSGCLLSAKIADVLYADEERRRDVCARLHVVRTPGRRGGRPREPRHHGTREPARKCRGRRVLLDRSAARPTGRPSARRRDPRQGPPDRHRARWRPRVAQTVRGDAPRWQHAEPRLL